MEENTVSLANTYYFKNSWFILIKLSILEFYYGITYFLQKCLGLFSFLSPWFKPGSHPYLVNHKFKVIKRVYLIQTNQVSLISLPIITDRQPDILWLYTEVLSMCSA